MKPLIVFLANAWGTRFGGINSFNADIARALARSAIGRRFDIACVVKADCSEEYSRSGIRLIPVPSIDPEGFAFQDAEAIVRSVHSDLGGARVLWWIGHDSLTGGAATRAAQLAGGKSAVIHHTSYIDYSGYKHGIGALAQEKFELQKRIFTEATQVLAIGPLLRDRLGTMLDRNSASIPILIPGLAEVRPSLHPSSTFTAVSFGRLDSKNDRIKQGRLAVAGFSNAVRKATEQGFPQCLLAAPRLKLIGAQEQEKELRNLALQQAGRVINILALPFEENRDKLFTELRQATVAIMASWHEGFGLAAWEAIAAGVPLLVGRNTGVYHLIEEHLSGAGAGCLHSIDVRATEDNENKVHAQDLADVSSAILRIAADIEKARRDAHMLRQMLSGCTWQQTVAQLAHALGLSNGDTGPIDDDPKPPPVTLPHLLWYPASRDLPFGSEDIDSATAMQESARQHYRRGEYQESHRASTHAALLFTRGNFHSDAVECLTEGITALRPIRSGFDLRKTVLDVERLCSRHKISVVARWHFLDRLALILFDYARWQKAAEVQRAGAYLMKTIGKDPWNPQRLEFDLANSRRRAAVIKGCAYAFPRGENIGKTLTELIEEGQEFKRTRHYNAFVTNLDVASKLASEVIGDRHLAHLHSEEALEWSAMTDNWWVLQEHYWRETCYFHWRNDKSRMLQNAVEAINLRQNHPVILEPILESGKPRVRNPDEDLTRFDIRGTLATQGVEISALVSIIPFTLTDDHIDRIVRTVIGS